MAGDTELSAHWAITRHHSLFSPLQVGEAPTDSLCDEGSLIEHRWLSYGEAMRLTGNR